MCKHEQYLLSHSCLQHILLFISLYFFSTRNILLLLIVYFVSGRKRCFLIRFGHFPVLHEHGRRPPTIKLMGNCNSLCDLQPGSYSSNQTTLLSELAGAPHSCNRHGLVAVGLASERPGSVIHFSKNIQPFLPNIVSLSSPSVSGRRLPIECTAAYRGLL
jgi:hypothetical protein